VFAMVVPKEASHRGILRLGNLVGSMGPLMPALATRRLM